MNRLAGRVALVTGAGRGLGRAIAARLASEGAALAVHYRSSKDGADELVREIASRGGRAIAVAGDLRHAADCRSMLDEAQSALGPVDSLVLNAAASRGAPLLAADFDGLRSTLDTNLLAPMQLTALALPAMLKSRFGRVVAISSVVGAHGGLTGQCAYAASKAGLFGFITTLANELSPRMDFTANLVSPGVIPTDMSAQAIADFGDRLCERIPLNHFGTPEDIAAAVAYLLAPEASYVNGHNLIVDGGFSLSYVSRKRRGPTQ